MSVRLHETNSGFQVSGVWRVTRDAANERERRARVWLAVSRALGDVGLKEPSPLVVCTPEIRTERLADDDLFMVLACDGVRFASAPSPLLGLLPASCACGSVALVFALARDRPARTPGSAWRCTSCRSPGRPTD